MDDYQWPDGRACGFLLGVDLDALSPMRWRLRGSGRADPPAEAEMRRFGLRQGAPRILALLEELDFPATFFVPASIAEEAPELVRRIAGQGLEVGLHGDIHEDVAALSRAENRAVLERSLEVLEDLLGKVPQGYRSPAWTMTPYLPELLEDFGITYDSSLMGYEHPYEVENLVELPVSWTADDATYSFYLGDGSDIGPPWPPPLVVSGWKEELASARRFGNLLSLTVHPWMIGRAARFGAFERFLREVRDDPAVWTADAASLAAYHRGSANWKRWRVELS